MNVLQITPYLSQSNGGPFFSVRRLSHELFAHGVHVDVAGIAYGDPENVSSYWQPLQLSTVLGSFPCFFGYGSGFPVKIATVHPQIVHTHGIWLYSHLAAYRYCTTKNTPLIVSPRGMLEPWAFKHKNWKKLPLWLAYEKRSLQSARVLHATAEIGRAHV